MTGRGTSAGRGDIGECRLVESAVTQLVSDARSVAAARRFVAAALEQWGRDDQIDEVTLLTSEVVTNAVLHAGSDVDVRVSLVGAVVRVEVGDRDPDPPVVRDTPVLTSGRGLRIVQEVAVDWGTYPMPDDGKVVWFEVA